AGVDGSAFRGRKGGERDRSTMAGMGSPLPGSWSAIGEHAASRSGAEVSNGDRIGLEGPSCALRRGATDELPAERAMRVRGAERAALSDVPRSVSRQAL